MEIFGAVAQLVSFGLFTVLLLIIIGYLLWS